MSEDAKSKLKEKMGAAVTDEQLEKVAGGTTEENLELIDELRVFNPQKVDALLKSANGDPWQIRRLATSLLSEFEIPALDVHTQDGDDEYEDNNEYYSLFDGEISHGEAIRMIRAEAAKRGLR